MFKAALKSLLGRKVRLLLSTSAIVLGVAFVAGSLVFIDTLNRSFTALFASTVGDVVVRPTGGGNAASGMSSGKTIPAALVSRLADIDGAARADGQIQAPGVFIIGRDGKVVGGRGAPSLGASWNDAPAGHGLKGMVIDSGRAPEKPNELVLDSATASQGGYLPGAKVPVVTIERKKPFMAELVGIAKPGDGGSLNGMSLIFFSQTKAQKLLLKGDNAFTTIWVTAAAGVTQDELRDRVAPELPKDLEAITGDQLAADNATFLMEALKFLTIFLLIFAAISLVVGAFLIVNTFSMLVAQRSRELALLRALGASSNQVSGSVLVEALVLGVLGSTVGIGVGILLAKSIAWAFGQAGLDLSGQAMVFAPRTFVAAYVIGVFVTMIAAWVPARRTSKIAPIAALRDDVAMPESSLKGRFLGGITLISFGLLLMYLGVFTDVPRDGWTLGLGAFGVVLGVAAASPVISAPFLAGARRLMSVGFGTVGNLAGQNALRNPRRTTVTASALMIGLAVAGTMTILADSAKSSVDQMISRSFRGDYLVGSTVGQPFATEIGDQIAKVRGVTGVTRMRWNYITNADKMPSAIGAAEKDALEPKLGLQVVSGKLADLDRGTVMVSESAAKQLALAPGDTTELNVNDKAQQYPVVGVFKDTPMMPFPFLTVPGTLDDAGFKNLDNRLVVDVALAGSAAQYDLEQVVKASPIISVTDQRSYAEEQRDPINRMVLMIFALLGLALVIAVLGIVNTLALSVIERFREIGLLRAVGLNRGQIRTMITLESVVISVLGALLGVGMGLLFGAAAVRSLADQGLEVFTVPWDQLAGYLGLAVVIGVLAAVLPARRAATLNVLGAIAHD